MTLSLSAAQRSALAETLESVLTDRDKLRRHLSHQGRSPIGWNQEPLDDHVYQEVLGSGARLANLRDAELVRLNADPVALLLLSSEIAAAPDAGPWHRLLADSGRSRAARLRLRAPTWAELTTPAIPFESLEPILLEGRLPEALGGRKPVRTRGLGPRRACLFDWPWHRELSQLTWRRGDVGSCGLPPERQAPVSFRLKALMRRGNSPGGWSLAVTGSVPAERVTALTVRLTGWGKSFEHLQPAGWKLGDELELTGWGDPTELFQGWETGGITITVEGDTEPCAWTSEEAVPSPTIDETFYLGWRNSLEGDGFWSCFERLDRRTGGDGPTIELLEIALGKLRVRRFIYGLGDNRVEGFRHFSNLVLRTSWNCYLDWKRQQPVVKPWEDLVSAGKVARPAGDDGADLIAELMACLDEVAEPGRTLVRQKLMENMTLQEIGDSRGWKIGKTWNQVNQAVSSFLRLLVARGHEKSTFADWCRDHLDGRQGRRSSTVT